MSRSRKKVSHSYHCVVNHRSESKHYKQRRRQYRRILNQYVRTHWHDEDMILPSHLRLFNKWDAPSDGCYIYYSPPEFENPYYRYTKHYYTTVNFNNFTRHKLPNQSEIELYLKALKSDYDNLQWYNKCLRK